MRIKKKKKNYVQDYSWSLELGSWLAVGIWRKAKWKTEYDFVHNNVVIS